MSWDASPTWSGYIFQGEVALCKALEAINNLGGDISDEDLLRLEEDEDFSLQTDDVEVFQVKAYLTSDASNLSKYKDVIEELINKHYYSITVFKDPRDRRKEIKTYSLEPKDSPIKCVLVTVSNISDIDPNLSSFNKRYSSINFDYFKIVHGQYTLGNICSKLDEQIKTLLKSHDIDSRDEDIELKRQFCSAKIHTIIKKRHQDKKQESIPLNTIIEWILNDSPLALNKEIVWYEITKIFFSSILSDIEHYTKSEEDQAVVKKLNKAVLELEKLSIEETIKLLNEHLFIHKQLDEKKLRQSAMDFIDSNTIENIVQRAIKEIKQDPIYETLQYIKVTDKKTIRYQLTAQNKNFNVNDSAMKIAFQTHCELIDKQPVSEDIDYFVTQSLEKSKEEVQEHLKNVTEAPAGFDDDRLYPDFGKKKQFGFKTIENTIKDLK